mmetsp:Transcript_23768/g.74818  ORF Transcript_23768/g.74818 Transcript_23768/m.74818 type:complete len:210 (-) Transcript_23768:2202-2831(-)
MTTPLGLALGSGAAVEAIVLESVVAIVLASVAPALSPFSRANSPGKPATLTRASWSEFGKVPLLKVVSILFMVSIKLAMSTSPLSLLSRLESILLTVSSPISLPVLSSPTFSSSSERMPSLSRSIFSKTCVKSARRSGVRLPSCVSFSILSAMSRSRSCLACASSIDVVTTPMKSVKSTKAPMIMNTKKYITAKPGLGLGSVHSPGYPS